MAAASPPPAVIRSCVSGTPLAASRLPPSAAIPKLCMRWPGHLMAAASPPPVMTRRCACGGWAKGRGVADGLDKTHAVCYTAGRRARSRIFRPDLSREATTMIEQGALSGQRLGDKYLLGVLLG